jgi:hypothetical protein
LDLLNKSEHPIIKLDARTSLRNRESFIRLMPIHDTNTKEVISIEVLEVTIHLLDDGSCLIRASLRTI